MTMLRMIQLLYRAFGLPYQRALSVCHTRHCRPGWWFSFSPHGEVRELKTEELKSSAHRAKNVVAGQCSWTDKSPSTKYVPIKPMITQREAYKNRPWPACSHRIKTLSHCYGLRYRRLSSDPCYLSHGKQRIWTEPPRKRAGRSLE